MKNIGYCCINQTLRQDNVYTGRSLIRRTFTLEKASELALSNCMDLLTILKWNAANNIRVFRIGSDFFPRMTDPISGYNFEQLETARYCREALSAAGKYAYEHNMILSCHPGQYTVLASDSDQVVKSAISELMMHSIIADMLRIDAPDLNFHINFHVGNRFSIDSAKRFCSIFNALPKHVQELLTLENDDKPNCWNVKQLYDYIHSETGIPIVFDYHHSLFSCPDDMTQYSEFLLASSTWGDDMIETHYSTSEDNTRKHSEYILTKMPDWMISDKVYVHFEVKQKELAVLKYIEDFS